MTPNPDTPFFSIFIARIHTRSVVLLNGSRLIRVFGVGLLITLSPFWVWASPVDECDRLAAHLDDPHYKDVGVTFDQNLLLEALDVCNRALEQEPENSRIIYQYGRALQANGKTTEGEAWIRKSAERLYPHALFAVGILEKGGTPPNMAKAAENYRKAAELKHPDSMVMLGYLLQNGLGLPPDAAEALVWYRRAAEMGNANGQTEVGIVNWAGFGVLQNSAEAARWFALAADRDSRAGYYLGIMYMTGDGVEKDSAKACHLFRSAAGHGNQGASGALGACYVFGRGVEVNYDEGICLLRKAAEQNDMDSMRWLGSVLVQPGRSNEDIKDGIDWLTKAAEMGDQAAANGLAAIYFYGHGVPMDKQKAAYWMSEAERLRKREEGLRPRKMLAPWPELPLGGAPQILPCKWDDRINIECVV
jgi:TPR repeat protein